MQRPKPTIANHNTERNIRHWLDSHGFIGRTAEFEEVELHAIKHPGWLQIYRFKVKAKTRSRGTWILLYGAVRDDETARKSQDITRIEAFESRAKQLQLLGRWSQGLMMKGQGSPLVLLWCGIAALLFAATAIILKLV